MLLFLADAKQMPSPAMTAPLPPAGLPTAPLPLGACHCQAVRQAARLVTALYDAALAPFGLRVSQFGILARLGHHGPRTIQALAAEMAMDRTTLGRNIRPLERDGLLSAVADPQDGRARRLSLSPRGAAAVAAADPAWRQAQARFEALYGAEPAAALHAALRGVVAALYSPRD